MIQGIHHASITTANLARLKAFYCDLLGFEVVLETSWGAGNAAADAIYGLKDSAVKMAMLRNKNACLELFEFEHPKGKANDPARPVCDQGYTHICLNVSDIEAEYARLIAAGMHFNCPPKTVPGLCSATYGRDPDGNLVELMEPMAGSAFDLAACRA